MDIMQHMQGLHAQQGHCCAAIESEGFIVVELKSQVNLVDYEPDRSMLCVHNACHNIANNRYSNDM